MLLPPPGPARTSPAYRVADAMGLADNASRDPGRRDVLVAAGATADDHEALTRRAHELLMAYNQGFAGLGDFGATLEVGWVTTPAMRQHFVELVRSRGSAGDDARRSPALRALAGDLPDTVGIGRGRRAQRGDRPAAPPAGGDRPPAPGVAAHRS